MVVYTTLIESETLATHLSDPRFAIIDCRFDLRDPEWGLREYRSRHIPGAIYAHLERDLSGQKTGSNGRHPLPSISQLSATFGRFGIDPDVQVIGYDQRTGVYASRLWWLLRWLGHQAVAVLDGGFQRWAAEGRPTTTQADPRAPRWFQAAPQSGATVTADEVATLMRHADWQLVDARAPERFRGESESLDPVAGHIPGAINRFFEENLDARGMFLSPDHLRAQFSEVLRGTPAAQVISYCGSGVTACHNLLALEHAGLPGARLYPGSWSEWASDPRRPVVRGPSPDPSAAR